MQTRAQKGVFRVLRDDARGRSGASREDADGLLAEGLNSNGNRDVERVKAHIGRSEIVIYFKPEKRIGAATLLDILRTSGHYLNTWQTGASGGDPNSVKRDELESERFGYAARDQEQFRDRPRYGWINRLEVTGGRNFQYGDAGFVLTRRIAERSTLTCVHDSVTNDFEAMTLPIGTSKYFNHLLVASRDLLGRRNDPTARKQWASLCERWLRAANGLEADPGLGVKEQWEAQVHSEIAFPEDVVFLRVPYRRYFGTPFGEGLKTWARNNGWPLLWGHKHTVIVDPEVCPETRPNDDWRWPHFRVEANMRTRAIERFNNGWWAAFLRNKETFEAKKPDFERNLNIMMAEIAKTRRTLEKEQKKRRPDKKKISDLEVESVNMQKGVENYKNIRVFIGDNPDGDWNNLWSGMPWPLRYEPRPRAGQQSVTAMVRSLGERLVPSK